VVGGGSSSCKKTKRRRTMRVVFEKRNSPIPNKNDLQAFQRLEAIVTSLTESTFVEVSHTDEGIMIKNHRYYLSMPDNLVISEVALKAIVLRSIRLSVLELLLMFSLLKEGRLRIGRLEEESSDEDLCRCVLEIVS
jgi:hypothetical protein